MSFVRPEGYTLEQGLKAVGPGWKGLVEQAFKNKPAKARIVQVKEKFGGLRIYTEGRTSKAFETLLATLETESMKTCEMCGEPGSRRGGSMGYILTLCAKDQKERMKRG